MFAILRQLGNIKHKDKTSHQVWARQDKKKNVMNVLNLLLTKLPLKSKSPPFVQNCSFSDVKCSALADLSTRFAF